MLDRNKLWFILLTVIFSQGLLATTYKREPESCFPLSSQKYVAGNKSLSGLSEEEFNQIVESALTVMGPEIKKSLNKKLIIEKRWSDATVDAFATRDEFNNPVIVINGGLARHPLMSKDAFLLLICHEIGHHQGGAPKIPRGNTNARSWSSAEGQADYFATSKCLPQFFKNGLDIKTFDIDQDSVNYKMALTKCRDNACARVAMAGLVVSKLFASLVSGTPEPILTKSDPAKVGKTYYKHPSPQCRLDTYLSGANCDLGSDIPFDNVDPKVGACLKETGARPACWFSEKDF